MTITIPKNLTEVKHHLHDPLFKNSVFIMLAAISGAGFGFIFWMLAAKLYIPYDIGIATALISSATLLVLLSRFGLDFSIIRFFPENDKSRIFSTSIFITTSFAILFGIIFIAGIDIFSPELRLLKSQPNALIFLIFLAVSSIAGVTGTSILAIRKGGFYLFQGILLGSRVLFIFPLIYLGSIGIFGAFGISFLLALTVSLVFLAQSGIRPAFKLDKGFLNDAFHFSVGNYFAGLFIIAPNTILPLMILEVLGAEQTAYYYVTFAIASLLFTIPNAINMSLFVEGSHGRPLKKTAIKALVITFSILIPTVILLHFFGYRVLGVIGADYAENGSEFLSVMVFASVFLAVNSIYFSIKRIQKDVRVLTILSGLIFVMIIGLSYAFMVRFGIVGVGYAWVVSYGVGTLMIGVMVWKEGWVRKKKSTVSDCWLNLESHT